MSPKRVVTPESVVSTIEEADRPFATTGDIADRLGVTKQAIRNRADELGGVEELENGKVGRQNAFWLAEREEPPEVVDEVDVQNRESADLHTEEHPTPPDFESGIDPGQSHETEPQADEPAANPPDAGLVLLDVIIERAVGMSVIGTAAFLLTASGAWRFADPLTFGSALVAWQLGTVALILLDRHKERVIQQIGFTRSNGGETA